MHPNSCVCCWVVYYVINKNTCVVPVLHVRIVHAAARQKSINRLTAVVSLQFTVYSTHPRGVGLRELPNEASYHMLACLEVAK